MNTTMELAVQDYRSKKASQFALLRVHGVYCPDDSMEEFDGRMVMPHSKY